MICMVPLEGQARTSEADIHKVDSLHRHFHFASCLPFPLWQVAHLMIMPVTFSRAGKFRARSCVLFGVFFLLEFQFDPEGHPN